MDIDSNKYTVFKTEDFNEALQDGGVRVGQVAILNNVRIDDAVVIRRRDIFASTALYSYANAIMAVIEIASELGLLDVDAEKYNNLRNLADYFTYQAELAQADGISKIPD